MALSNPIASFGIHQATIKDLVTHDLFTMLILDSAEPDFTQDLVDLRGGSSAFPWASAPGEAAGEISITVKQFDAGVLQFFSPYASGAVTENAAEALGNVGILANGVGTSMVAAGGFASVAATGGSEADLKYGDYIIKAINATTFNIYVNTSVDGATYIDDTLKLNSVALTNPGTGGTVAVAGYGLTFTAGVGASAMVAGDTAYFSVRPINTYSMIHKIGMLGSSPKEFELTIAGEKIGSKIRVVRFPKCIAGGGAGLKFPYKDWATFDTTIKLLQDATEQLVGVETFINR